MGFPRSIVEPRYSCSSNSSNNDSDKITNTIYVNLKTACELIPKFDGYSTHIQKFSKCCKDAEESVYPGDRAFLFKPIRNKSAGNADKYLSNQTESINNLNDHLCQLEPAFIPRNDLNKLNLGIANSQQHRGESAFQYGIGINETLNKLLETIDLNF